MTRTASIDIIMNPTDNLLICGDNLQVMQSLSPHFAHRVKLVYVDPPYNTHRKDFGYNDTFEREQWLSFMRSRLEAAVALMTDDGALVVQCDDHEQAYLKVMMDSFSGLSFLNCIAVKMSEPTGVKMNHGDKRFPKIKEYLLVYVRPGFKGFVAIDKYKSDGWDPENDLFLEGITPDIRQQLIYLQAKDRNTEADAKVATDLLKSATLVPLGKKLQEQRFADSKAMEAWLYDHSHCIVKTAGSESLTKIVSALPHQPEQDVAAALSSRKVLFFYLCHYNRKVRQPRLRVLFADENLYKHPCDFWHDIKTSGAVAKEGGVELHNGKKPERLLYRLIKMFTHEGDLVMDPFMGSGTTCAVAHKMNRQYIGIETLPEHFNLALRRLQNVVDGDPTGISTLVNWQGGGAFVTLQQFP